MANNSFPDHFSTDGFALEDHRMYPPAPTPGSGFITVSDLERLAKAGVKVELNEHMSRHVISDPPPERRILFDSTDLLVPLVERWRQITGDGVSLRHGVLPFWFSAVKNGGTVYLFVCCNLKTFSAQIIEDDAKFYPSEALIAKLHLLLDNHNNSGA